MKIRIQFSGQLRAAAGTAELDLDLPDGTPAFTLLNHVAQASPAALRGMLLDDAGRSRPGLLVFQNDEQVNLAELGALEPGARFTLMTGISGG